MENFYLNVLLYYSCPVIVYILGRYFKWKENMKQIAINLLYLISFCTWFMSFWNYIGFEDAFMHNNFNFVYVIITTLIAAMFGFLIHGEMTAHDMLDYKVASSKAIRLKYYYITETIFFTIILSLLTAFMKDVYELSGRIYIRELIFMTKQAGAYKGNFDIIFAYLEHFSLTLFLPSAIIIYKYYKISKFTIKIDLVDIKFKPNFRWLTIVYLLSFLFISRCVIKSDTIITQAWFDANAVIPSLDLLDFPKTLPNIIFIELESYESVFASKAHGGYLDESRIPNFERMALDPENVHFTQGDNNTIGGSITLDLTRFTTSSLFGQFCGVPFMGENFKSKNQAGSQELYLSEHQCMSDLLKKMGYEISATFGSRKDDWQKGLFFSMHSFDTINSHEGQGWVFDKYTFPRFQKQIENHAKSNKPWFAFILTIDTHEPSLICKDCPEDTEKLYRSTRCTDKRVYNFIQWAKTHPWYNNTVIFITGDHMSRQKVTRNLAGEDRFKRRSFNLFINAKHGEYNRTFREYTVFDLYPTVLSAAGIKIKGDKLGIGINLFSNQSTYLEKMGHDDFVYELEGTTNWYNSKYLGMDSTCTGNDPCMSGKIYIGDWKEKTLQKDDKKSDKKDGKGETKDKGKKGPEKPKKDDKVADKKDKKDEKPNDKNKPKQDNKTKPKQDNKNKPKQDNKQKQNNNKPKQDNKKQENKPNQNNQQKQDNNKQKQENKSDQGKE